MADESKPSGEPQPSDKPFKVVQPVLPLRQRVFRADWTDSGDEPVDPPAVQAAGQDYLPALRDLLARVVDRYGGPDALDAFVRSHLHGLPTDAAVALMLRNQLQALENAIAANDIYGAIAATAAIERSLAARWRYFNNATGHKSAQARKEKAGETDRERANLYEQCTRKIERLQRANPHLSKNAAVILATKEIGKSRSWFYRCENRFATGR